MEKTPLLLTRPKGPFVLAVHAGAGTLLRENSTPQQRAEYHAALRHALLAGYAVLRDGGEALDAGVAAVTVLEDCPFFNAGKGSVFNVDGKHELEASVMLSKPPSTHTSLPASRRGLALTLLTKARNPCKLARDLYLSPSLTPHVLLSGTVAETLGSAELVDQDYYFTEHRWREHRRGLGLPEEPLPPGHSPSHPPNDIPLDQMPQGTVGAVALDVRGCIAAVTSTGGKTNKQVGRIGDTPQTGTGFWVEEWKTECWLRRVWSKLRGKGTRIAVGVSGTGDGDYFIRQATACSLAHRMRYRHESVSKAALHVVQDLYRDGGLGGVIAVDNTARVAMPLNCPGMYRGVIRDDGVPKTAIFHDDVLK